MFIREFTQINLRSNCVRSNLTSRTNGWYVGIVLVIGSECFILQHSSEVRW